MVAVGGGVVAKAAAGGDVEVIVGAFVVAVEAKAVIAIGACCWCSC